MLDKLSTDLENEGRDRELATKGVYEKPTFTIEEVEVGDMAADFNPADACVVVGSVITAAVIWAAARC